jgi:hypothetical protein
MENNLEFENIQDTYQRLIQVVDNILYDGSGNLLELSLNSIENLEAYIIYKANTQMLNQINFINLRNEIWI